MYSIALSQMLQQMVRADLVAFVGRVGNAVCEIQNILHRTNPDF